MGRIDPEQERQRLAEFYSRQMDGELEKVATQAQELSEIARTALKVELSRRGLSVEPLEHLPEPLPPVPPPVKLPSAELPAWLDAQLPLRELTTLRKFRDLPEALLARGCLESAGIESCLVDDNMVRLDWFWSNLIGGIKLQVREEDAEAAESILDQPIPQSFEVEGIGEYQQPACPKCQSLDVSFQELDRPIAYTSAYLNVPIPLRRRAWRCHVCRSEWEDDRADGSNVS
jgi:Putative prokaryotic signal transducing protein